MPVIDLDRNTIDGRRHWRRVVELASILAGGPLRTDDVIRRMYGLAEPDDAANAVKQIAFVARRSGVPIQASLGRGSQYRLG